jgi:hypothetical protein
MIRRADANAENQPRKENAADSGVGSSPETTKRQDSPKRKSVAKALSDDGEEDSKPKRRKKKKDTEEDSKTLSLSIDRDPAMTDKLSHAVISGLATIFDFPVQDAPIMASVIFQTAELLRQRNKQ